MPFRFDLEKFADFKKKVEENVSFFIDPVMQEIPSDPVFISYLKEEQVRVMSQSTLEQLYANLRESKTIIQKISDDPSHIQIVLAKQPTEAKPYKAIMEVLVKENPSEILDLCLLFDGLKQMAKDTPSQSYILLSRLPPSLAMFDELIQRYFYIEAEGSLFDYYMELFLEQSAEAAIHDGRLRDANKEPLNINQVICPYTRATIQVRESLSSNLSAEQFVALSIVLCSEYVKIEDDSLSNFIEEQPVDYVKQAKKTFYSYLLNPEAFNFTDAQEKFLNEMGMQEAFRQFKPYKQRQLANRIKNDSEFIELEKIYGHLWDIKKGIKANVLSVLKDYEDPQDFFSQLKLFFSNPSEPQWVQNKLAILIKKINMKDNPLSLINTFYSDSSINTQGPLGRRLFYLKKRLELAQYENKPWVDVQKNRRDYQQLWNNDKDIAF